jgi:hypothetical protein
VTGRTFEPRAFDIDQVMAPSFGIFDGDGVPVDIRIRFRGKGVRLIQERYWHRSEKMEQLPDGTVVLHLRVAHTPATRRMDPPLGKSRQSARTRAVRDGVEKQAREILAPWT